jgi:hypothetical protein
MTSHLVTVLKSYMEKMSFSLKKNVLLKIDVYLFYSDMTYSALKDWLKPSEFSLSSRKSLLTNWLALVRMQCLKYM